MVHPDAGYTPLPRHQGYGPRGAIASGIAWMPDRIKAGTKSHDLAGGLDLMATFTSLAGVKLPDKDREGEPIIFDSFDMSPVLFGTGISQRTNWFYFTENELSPGAVRFGNLKPSTIFAATMASKRWARRRQQSRLEGQERPTYVRLFLRSSILGPIPRSVSTSS